MHQSFDIRVIGHAILKHLLLTVMLIDRVVGFTEEKIICQRFMDMFLTSNKRRKHKMIPRISNLEWAQLSERRCCPVCKVDRNINCTLPAVVMWHGNLLLLLLSCPFLSVFSA